MVYAGLGFILWRDQLFLPKDLVFHLDYLGDDQDTFTLSFSRPGGQVIAQYYNFMRLGFDGFRSIVEQCLENARALSRKLEDTKMFKCVSSIHIERSGTEGDVATDSSLRYHAGLPVVAFHFSHDLRKDYPSLKLHDLSDQLRMNQFILPCKNLLLA